MEWRINARACRGLPMVEVLSEMGQRNRKIDGGFFPPFFYPPSVVCAEFRALFLYAFFPRCPGATFYPHVIVRMS